MKSSSEEGTQKESAIETAEERIEEVAEELQVKLPHGRFLTFPMRVFTLLMMIGGLGILGSSLTDFVLPRDGGVGLYFFRIATGVAFLGVGYGVLERQRWASWLYGAIVFIGLFLNFALSILPAFLVGYLYYKRHSLHPCFMDRLAIEYGQLVKEKGKALWAIIVGPRA